MRQYLAGRIRNIALTGHSDSGKTSLAEALLFKAGASDRLGKVAEGNTVSDYDPEEIKRQVSVSTSIAPFAWGSTKINLIDTPGLFDFAGETAEGARAAESLLITVSGKSGVGVGTEKAYKMAKDASKATMFFVSKLDAEHADFYKVFEELKATFGPTVCPIVVPYVEENEVKSYINLIDMKAYAYNEKGEPHEVEMPDFGHRLDGLTAAVSEAVAETDEALFEKYFSGEQFTRDEIIRGVHTGVTARFPLFCAAVRPTSRRLICCWTAWLTCCPPHGKKAPNLQPTPKANRLKFPAPTRLLWQLMSLKPLQTRLSANCPM